MSFLDRGNVDFSKREPNYLRDLIVLAFPHRNTVRRIAEKADLVPGTFPDIEPNLLATVHELLHELARQSILRAFVECASDEPAAREYSPQFLAILGDEADLPTSSEASRTLSDTWKADPERETARLERLMEQRSRLIDIGVARLITEAARSVARLVIHYADKGGTGTGFLIAPDLILTNEHNVVHEDYGPATSVVAEFDYEEGIPADKRLVRQGVVAGIQSDAAQDWAVIPLDKKVDREPILLGSPYEVAVDDAVIIIQHPLSGFKRFALDPISVRFVGRRLDPVLAKELPVIQYVADTQKGSSGSPVFSERMHLVGLHHAEAPKAVSFHDQDKQLQVWFNEAIQISAIVDSLRAANIPYETANQNE